MPNPRFISVPTELLEAATAAYDHFRLHGYSVKAEQRDSAFPRVPTLLCHRGHETLIVEIGTSWRPDPLEHWLAYCKSRPKDTRLALVLPVQAKALPKLTQFGSANKVGIFTSNGGFKQILAPVDLAMTVHLPALNTLSVRVRKYMGPIYTKWDIDWRDALDDACQAVEVEARKYLAAGVVSGRIIVLKDNGTVRNLTSAQIGKMTLGQLANAFKNILNKNVKDSIIASTLPAINPERIGLAHDKPSAAVEKRLRKNAPTHMWAIINCLKELCSK